MMKKIALVTVAAGAYVLGAKAGRERYEQIRDLAQRFWQNPRVEQKRAEATQRVRDQAPAAKEHLTHAAHQAADKVTPGSDHDTAQEGARATTPTNGNPSGFPTAR